MIELTLTNLNIEYLNWSIQIGDRRDEQDLRFGQYLWSKYIMESFTDVFNNESCEEIYSILLKDLYEREER